MAGLFGMNVGGIPLAEDRGGFWIICALVAVFTAAVAWWRTADACADAR